MNNEKMISTEKAAMMLGITTGHLRNLMSQRKIPFYKAPNKRCYFDIEVINERKESFKMIPAQQ